MDYFSLKKKPTPDVKNDADLQSTVNRSGSSFDRHRLKRSRILKQSIINWLNGYPFQLNQDISLKHVDDDEDDAKKNQRKDKNENHSKSRKKEYKKSRSRRKFKHFSFGYKRLKKITKNKPRRKKSRQGSNEGINGNNQENQRKINSRKSSSVRSNETFSKSKSTFLTSSKKWFLSNYKKISFSKRIKTQRSRSRKVILADTTKSNHKESPTSNRNNLKPTPSYESDEIRVIILNENLIKHELKESWPSLLSSSYQHSVISNISNTGRQLLIHWNSHRFPSNKIYTGKYNLFTFLPKNLYEQFRRIANFYFLFLIIIQSIPQFSNINPILAALPLLIVTSLTALKDGLEDLKRHKSDRFVNGQKAVRLDFCHEPSLKSKLVRELASPFKKNNLNIEKNDYEVLTPPNTKETVVSSALSATSNSYGDLSMLTGEVVDVGYDRIKDWTFGNKEDLHIFTEHENHQYGIKGKSDLNYFYNASSSEKIENPDIYLEIPGSATPKKKNKIDQFDNSSSHLTWQDISWKNVHVGDILFLKNDEPIPADCILLDTSEENGICYVETQNLDGETNLKMKYSVQWNSESFLSTSASEFSRDKIAKLRGRLEVENPTASLLSFKGKLILTSSARNLNVEENMMINSPKSAFSFDSSSTISAPSFQSLHQSGSLRQHQTLDDSLLLMPSRSQKSMSRKKSKSPLLGQFTHTDFQTIPLFLSNLILRGCVIRNTSWAIAIVIYTGEDTKLMKNLGSKIPLKMTRIERQINRQVIINFALLSVLCLSCSLSYISWISTYLNTHASFLPNTFSSYSNSNLNSFSTSHSPLWLGFLTLWSQLILFQTIVPLALYITVEICKTVQAYFIHSDLKLYNTDMQSPCIPKAWNLSDNLGQIQVIVSDKTGTLTENKMELRRISIAGVSYGLDPPDGESWHWKDATLIQMIRLMQQRLPRSYFPFFKDQTNEIDEAFSPTFTFVDPNFWQQLVDSAQNDSKLKSIEQFFITLILCHTVLVDKKQSDKRLNLVSLEAGMDVSNLDPYSIKYKAQSPDEAALLSSARSVGFIFLGRTIDDIIYLSILNEIKKYRLLHILEFTSERKRMSVIVQEEATSEIFLLCKGADSVIYGRLNTNKLKGFELDTQRHLESWAEKGLRTLCFAAREILLPDYQKWETIYKNTLHSLGSSDDSLFELQSEIEQNLELLGATGIEDALQMGVPETIHQLRKAGIKIWLATGDKIETAINVAFSCQLLTRDMLLMVISSENGDSSSLDNGTSIKNQIKEALEQKLSLDAGVIGKEYFETKYKYGSQGANFLNEFDQKNWSRLGQRDRRIPLALIIDGGALKVAFQPAVRRTFLELAYHCDSVISCRVSPIQKAKLVQLIKRGKNQVTLAVGDGANDVSMIQAADVGVGISGKEGQQAVMSSDYGISQFRHLSRLLLVHGRWSYHRIASITLLSFYKNILFSVVLFWYQFDSGFTGNYVYDYMFVMFYNLFFCTAPLFVLGILDQDVPEEAALALPQLYGAGVRGRAYSIKLFLLMLVEAVFQSAVCYYSIKWCYLDDEINGSDGFTETKALLGSAMGFLVIFLINIVAALYNLSWSLFTLIGVLLSYFLCLLCFIVSAYIPDDTLNGVPEMMIRQPLLPFCFVLAVVVALLPRGLYYSAKKLFRPTDKDIVRELSFMINKKWNKLAKNPLMMSSGKDYFNWMDEEESGKFKDYPKQPKDIFGDSINCQKDQNTAFEDWITQKKMSDIRTLGDSSAEASVLPSTHSMYAKYSDSIECNNQFEMILLKRPPKLLLKGEDTDSFSTRSWSALSLTENDLSNKCRSESNKQKSRFSFGKKWMQRARLAILNMKTGKFEKLRGYAFAQGPGSSTALRHRPREFEASFGPEELQIGMASPIHQDGGSNIKNSRITRKDLLFSHENPLLPLEKARLSFIS